MGFESTIFRMMKFSLGWHDLICDGHWEKWETRKTDPRWKLFWLLMVIKRKNLSSLKLGEINGETLSSRRLSKHRLMYCSTRKLCARFCWDERKKFLQNVHHNSRVILYLPFCVQHVCASSVGIYRASWSWQRKRSTEITVSCTRAPHYLWLSEGGEIPFHALWFKYRT